MAPSARAPCGRSRTAPARVLRQLIVNACSLSDVAFTLLASFRGLAVSLLVLLRACPDSAEPAPLPILLSLSSFQPAPILLGLPGSQPALIVPASFERLTLYHSRVIKQAVIFRAVLRSRLESRRIESHRQSPPPLFSSPNFLLDVRRFCRPFPASRLLSSWRAILILLHAFSLQAQPKMVKRPPWDAAGASDASF